MKLDVDVAQELFFEGETDEYKIVESGEWKQDGKYQFQEVIFTDKSGKFFSLGISRSGSPFSDWTYDFEWSDSFECPEVVKAEVITYKWIVKK